MAIKKPDDQQVDINFESHPPIDDDVDGITKLLRQTLIQFANCNSLAKYLIQLKDITQVIAQDSTEEEDKSEEEDPDDDIFGVSSVIELPTGDKEDGPESGARKDLLRFLMEKCPDLRKLLERGENRYKIGMVVNERYINLPPQLSLPTFTELASSLARANYTHLVFVCKILLKARSSDSKLPSKKSKSSQSSSQDFEPLIFINPEEEIICENSESYVDIDVSSYCDENATWSFKSDVKYIPHRRLMIVDYKKWPSIMEKLEEELK